MEWVKGVCTEQAERLARTWNLTVDESEFWSLTCGCGESHLMVAREDYGDGPQLTLYWSSERRRWGIWHRVREAWAWLRGVGYEEHETILEGVELAQLQTLAGGSGWNILRGAGIVITVGVEPVSTTVGEVVAVMDACFCGRSTAVPHDRTPGCSP